MEKFNSWLKRLPIGLIGLVAFIGIMGCLTAAFNWFWSGLGKDPTHYYVLPFATTFNDFKEYAALYIPLISFGATLFAGFVVFLVFNDWKEQHNQSVDSKYYSQALESFKRFSISVNKFNRLYEEYCDIPVEREPNIEFFQKKHLKIRSEALENLANFQGDLIFLQSLSTDQLVISTLEQFFQQYIKVAKSELSKDPIPLNFYNSYTDHEQFKTDLYNNSYEQGQLVGKHLKNIVQFLNSKIKA